MDSYIGKLRSIFHAKGRDGEWDKRLGLGNPAADKSVKDYPSSVRGTITSQNHAQASYTFFVDTLTILSLHLQRELEKSTSAIQRFIIARDQAYFKTAFFSGDRPGDLGQVKVPEILRFPNNDSFLFNHVWGKNFEGGGRECFWNQTEPTNNHLSH